MKCQRVCVCLGFTGQTHSMWAALFPLLLRNDWQLSCLHHCRVIFVRSHPFDRGSEGLLSQEMAYCFSALQSITYRRAMPVISLCLCLCSFTLDSVISRSNIPWVLLLLLRKALHCIICPRFYCCKSSVACTPHGFSVMIINLNRLFARKTIYIPVIGSCVKLLSDF